MLGVAGLLGSGRTELARALTGIDRLDAGIIRIQGSDAEHRRPAVGDLARRRLLVGEPPHRGHHQRAERAENITLALQAERGILRRIRPSRQRELARELGRGARHPAAPTSTGPPAPSRAATSRRCCSRGCSRCRRACSCSTSRPAGIDVGAKVEIQNLVGELADNGLSVMFISAELEEVLRVGNRVAILRDGRIVDTLPSEELTVDSLIALVARPDERR